MFKKFLKSKNKTTAFKEKVKKPIKKIIKEINQKQKEPKETIVSQFSANKLLTAEGWLRRQKKSL